MAWTRSRYGRTDHQGHIHKDTDYRGSWQPVQRDTNTVGTEVLPPYYGDSPAATWIPVIGLQQYNYKDEGLGWSSDLTQNPNSSQVAR